MSPADIQYAAVMELIGGVGDTLFVALYGLLSRWYLNPYGQNIMFFSLGLGFLFDYGAIYYFLEYPDPAPTVMIRVQQVVIALLVLLVWQRLYQMIRAQISLRATPWRKEQKHDHERRLRRRLRFLSGRRESD